MGRNSRCSDFFFNAFRWAWIVAFLFLVARGWYYSFHKYSRGQTSISLVRNETDMFRYPSVTFCPMFVHGAKLTEQILGRTKQDSCAHRCGGEYSPQSKCQCNPTCTDDSGDNRVCCRDYQSLCLEGNTTTSSNISPDLTVDDFDLSEYVDAWTWKRRDFLTFFTHAEHGDPRTATHVLDDDSYWTETIPHVYQSGKCFTYDAPFESPAGSWHGIRFGLKVPDGHYRSEEEREHLLKAMMRIFIHEKGKFYFYIGSEYPSSHRLDVSWLRFGEENSIDLSYKIFTALNTKERPCSDDLDYDFNKCVDLQQSKRRGCQAPWHFYNDSDIPLCRNIEEAKYIFSKTSEQSSVDYNRPYQTPLWISNYTNCPLPCTTSTIMPSFSYSKNGENSNLNYLNGDADWIVQLYFKQFLFTYETEYQVCDGTCLIGEIGGNMGFFLGGSLMAMIDWVVIPGMKKIAGM